MNVFLKSKRIYLFEFEELDLIEDLDSNPAVMKYISHGIVSDESEVNRAMGVFLSWKGKY